MEEGDSVADERYQEATPVAAALSTLTTIHSPCDLTVRVPTSTIPAALYAFETFCSSLGVSGVSPDLVSIGRVCRHVRRTSSRALRDVARATHVKKFTSRASLNGKELARGALHPTRFREVAEA